MASKRIRIMYLKEDNVTEASENTSNTPPIESEPEDQRIWIFVDSFLFIVIVSGNVLTILAIAWARKLRNVISNYFILNLAVADLLVGVTLPYHLAFYVDQSLNSNKTLCISLFVIIGLACGGSICNLIAIAIDRYIAIVYPLRYNAYATRKRVLIIIAIIWTFVISVYSIPIYWNCFETAKKCEMQTILPSYYLLYIVLPSFSLSWITMFLLYWKIWREAHKHARRMNLSIIPNIAGKHDHKSVHVVLLILGCFSICWLPFFVVACIRLFLLEVPLSTLYKSTFALAVANSGMNPFIYAWKNTNFRKTFQKILHFKSPNRNFNSSFKIYLENQRELQKQQTNVENGIDRNDNLHECSSSQSNLAEENRINNTIL
ncbi:5-hydroxytryptamine receptor 1 [Cataglyphis hispanica]|uniref:5-hydroxytryptamine receptor 1 n=1 Tax=Cataglyphis hispanica TaxID=1086592 RepID=UPI00217F3222|nr:5-hydroxytryptamine receptor 1 [Cataglyphis hispanica]XP_050447151.1 5-hydroxytryptamine receptor 1 [Cataglyphis hispanica]XP_050447152.1 5-hydroxytryptamine receptor 1 [Cataglyphis hispanica]